jgi:hypothetical protein
VSFWESSGVEFSPLFGAFSFSSATWAQTPRGIPVFEITPAQSKISFYVAASVSIEGTFDKWNATLTFSSPDVTTALLDVEIQAGLAPSMNLLGMHVAELILLHRTAAGVDRAGDGGSFGATGSHDAQGRVQASPQFNSGGLFFRHYRTIRNSRRTSFASPQRGG